MNGLHCLSCSLARSFRLLALVLVWLLLPWPCVVGDGADARDDTQVDLPDNSFKTLFLQKIPARVTWPDSTFAGTNTNVVIAILGPDPFNGLMEKVAAKHNATQKGGGRSIVVKTGVAPQTITNIHVLFVPAEQQANWLQWRKLAESSGSTGVLTVGEHPGFLDSGGIVKVLPAKQQFEVNVGNARRSRLQLDPNFVRVANKR